MGSRSNKLIEIPLIVGDKFPFDVAMEEADLLDIYAALTCLRSKESTGWRLLPDGDETIVALLEVAEFDPNLKHLLLKSRRALNQTLADRAESLKRPKRTTFLRRAKLALA